MPASTQDQRRRRLSALAKAPADRLQALWSEIGEEPEHRLIRGPEFGSVMVRGRAGSTGAPFNLGEVTVTRCSVALADGTVGHGYVQGRSAAAARIVALADALAEAGQQDRIEAGLVGPLEEERTAARKVRAGKAAATKVDFFTMVRGENT